MVNTNNTHCVVPVPLHEGALNACSIASSKQVIVRRHVWTCLGVLDSSTWTDLTMPTGRLCRNHFATQKYLKMQLINSTFTLKLSSRQMNELDVQWININIRIWITKTAAIASGHGWFAVDIKQEYRTVLELCATFWILYRIISLLIITEKPCLLWCMYVLHVYKSLYIYYIDYIMQVICHRYLLRLFLIQVRQG